MIDMFRKKQSSEQMSGMPQMSMNNEPNENQSRQTDQIAPIIDPSQQDNGNIAHKMWDTKDILDEIEHKLMGEVLYWDDQKQTFDYRKLHEPLMNKQGISSMMMVLHNYMHRHTALSNLQDEDIKRIALRCRLDVLVLLRLKWQDFQVKTAYLRTIVGMLDSAIYMMLRRAYKGGERESMSGRYRLVESIINNTKANQNANSLANLFNKQ